MCHAWVVALFLLYIPPISGIMAAIRYKERQET
jgi:hypothetical protein